MSGLILPPELSGKGAGYNAGKNSPKTTAQQLFTALFNGQSHLQEALSGHKIPCTWHQAKGNRHR